MNEVIEILKKVDAIITNSHFVGTSGKHMGTYVNKDNLNPHTNSVSKVGKLFALKFKNKKIEAIIAPAVGGIPLSQWTAYHLSKLTKKDVLSFYTEKTENNNQIFKRGYDVLVKDKRILVIEDTVTTGGSVKRAIETVKKSGGKVVAACVMINRDPKLINTKNMGAPFFSLAILKVPSYEAKNCPLCKAKIPINIKVGHGKKYLASRQGLALP